MPDNCGNIYGAYRRAAGLTQELAAELLDCAVRTLANWETGINVPPDDKVLRMVDVYHAPSLAIEHLRATTALARDILPRVDIVPLPQAVCNLVSRINGVVQHHVSDELLQIAADGRVDELELPTYEALMAELADIVEAAMELRYAEGGYYKP